MVTALNFYTRTVWHIVYRLYMGIAKHDRVVLPVWLIIVIIIPVIIEHSLNWISPLNTKPEVERFYFSDELEKACGVEVSR